MGRKQCARGCLPLQARRDCIHESPSIRPRLRRAESARALLCLTLAVALLQPAMAWGQELLLPEWDFEASEDASKLKRAAGESAEFTYSFVNDTVSDTWSITKSPLHWRARDWAIAAAIAGVTTGMIYSIDSEVRNSSQKSETFHSFGETIRPLGNGPGLVALTGGFALAGIVLDRPKERETARLLLEASAVGALFTVAGKYTFGRSRPREDRGPLAFEPFSGEVSMPSGETTSAFIMAGVVTSQYPQWYWQVLMYSMASAVGAGRIALDSHWASDVFLSAALGIAISKSIVHFNRKRKERRRLEKARGIENKRDLSRHFFQVTTRSFRWTYVW
jgi:membrane-associated phospholipid phosphatase